MIFYFLFESFVIENRIIGGRVSLYLGLLYFVKLLFNNEGCFIVCGSLVLGVLFYVEWKIVGWLMRSSFRGLGKWFEGNK